MRAWQVPAFWQSLDMSRKRMTTLWFVLLAFSPFIIFDSDNALISCLSYFWHFLPLLYLTVIMLWFRVCYVSRTPFIIFCWYLVVSNKEQDQTTCHIQEWQLWLFFSSPEPKAQGELLWPSVIHCVSSVVRHPSVNSLLKRHLLLNWWMDFEIILQDCSLGDPLPKLPKWFSSAK